MPSSAPLVLLRLGSHRESQRAASTSTAKGSTRSDSPTPTRASKTWSARAYEATRPAGNRRQARASKDHPPRAGEPPVFRVSLQARTAWPAHRAVATTRSLESRGRTGKHCWRSSTVV